MTSIELKHQARLLEWAGAIRDCRSSGLSVRQWCRERRTTPTTYYRWERELLSVASTAKAPPETPAAAFAELPVPKQVCCNTAERFAALQLDNVSMHLDHGESLEVAKQFIDAGFTSVMIDGSHYPYEENVAMTKSVCDYAHAHGVTVEGELGTISGIEDGVSSDKGLYTDPQQALDFARRTGVDSLAVAVGTSHGAYKFKPGQKPKLRFDILQEIEQVLPGLPIVLHGASSVNQEDVRTINKFGGNIQKAIGIPEEMLAEAAKMAVCKVNVDTDLRLAMTAAVRKTLSEDPAVIDTRKYIGAGRSLVKERVAYKMENILQSAHRY